MSVSPAPDGGKARQNSADGLLSEILSSLARPNPTPETQTDGVTAKVSPADALEAALLSPEAEPLAQFLAGLEPANAPTPTVLPAPVIADTLESVLRRLFKLGGPKPTVSILSDQKVGFVFEWGNEAVAGLTRFLLEETDLKAVPPAPVAATETGPVRKILIVEDDAVSRALLRSVMRKLPRVELVEAVNGRAGWKVLEDGFVPDLCISDVMMPEMTGLQLAQKIRGDFRFAEMEVILCTALSDRETVTKAAYLRVDFLLKPFTATKVLEKMDLALKRAAARNSGGFDAVRERLGLEEEDYRLLLEALIAEINSTLTGIRHDLAILDCGSAVTKIRGLKGSSLNIGDKRLADLTAQAEVCITRGDLEPAMKALENVQGETFRLQQSAARLSKAKVEVIVESAGELEMRRLMSAEAGAIAAAGP